MRAVDLLILAGLLPVAALGACADVTGAAYAPSSGGNAGVDAGPSGSPASAVGSNAPRPSADGGAIAAAGPATVSPQGGVDFRVWAPHATAARVTGDFPEATVSMPPVGAGVFAVHVTSAHAGSSYNFMLDTPAGTVTRLDPYCRELSGKTCLVVDPNAYAWQKKSFPRPAREGSVVYELHVGSFGATPTFAGVRARLDDLANLGVNVIELMPVNDFGGNPNGWGYNPELWLAPKVAYGAPDALRALVDDAHVRGIAVWIDIVMNHYTGYTQAPLYCFDGFCPQSSAGSLFFPIGSTYQTTPWGPRPNYQELEVSNLLLSSIKQWLTEYQGDGFRWDSVSNIRAIDGAGTTPGGKELLVAANNLTHSLGGTSVAEDLKGYAAITTSAAASGFGFDAQWDGFGYDVTNVLANPSDDARDLGVIQNALTASYAGDPFARLLFLEDHDTVGNGGARLPVKIDSATPDSFDARRRDMLGAVMLLTAPGVPMLFQGEEFLATGAFNDPPDPLAPPTTHGTQIRAFYKDMIALRRTIPGFAMASIDVFHRNDTAKVIAYQRGTSIVVVNLRNKAYTEYDVGVPTAGPWNIRLNTETPMYGDDFVQGQTGAVVAKAGAKDGRPFTLPLQLGAYAAMVLTP